MVGDVGVPDDAEVDAAEGCAGFSGFEECGVDGIVDEAIEVGGDLVTVGESGGAGGFQCGRAGEQQ